MKENIIIVFNSRFKLRHSLKLREMREGGGIF